MKTREPKSVTAGIQRRGQWDVIRDKGNKGALEVEIVEDTVVYASESLEFKLEVPCMEPFKESDFLKATRGRWRSFDAPLRAPVGNRCGRK